MRNYELMFIIKPTLDDEASNSVYEDIKKFLVKEKAEILEEKAMGRRELAYEIEKFNNGNYFLICVNANKETVKEFERLCNINENIIRHLVVRR